MGRTQRGFGPFAPRGTTTTLRKGVTACRLEIRLSENGKGSFADITYSHTSIGSAGDEFVAKFTADHYQKFMQAWERELNHFLETGVRLADGDTA